MAIQNTPTHNSDLNFKKYDPTLRLNPTKSEQDDAAEAANFSDSTVSQPVSRQSSQTKQPVVVAPAASGVITFNDFKNDSADLKILKVPAKLSKKIANEREAYAQEMRELEEEQAKIRGTRFKFAQGPKDAVNRQISPKTKSPKEIVAQIKQERKEFNQSLSLWTRLFRPLAGLFSRKPAPAPRKNDAKINFDRRYDSNISLQRFPLVEQRVVSTELDRLKQLKQKTDAQMDALQAEMDALQAESYRISQRIEELDDDVITTTL